LNFTPAQESKLALIREFIRLNGGQDDIDRGRLLDRFWLPGGDVFTASPDRANPSLAMERAREAIAVAYARRREAFQQAYEQQAHREFVEAELGEVNAFLRTAAGQHYRDACRRMTPYDTTAGLIREVVEEACAMLWADAQNRSAG
jgi:hypothetical protein